MASLTDFGVIAVADMKHNDSHTVAVPLGDRSYDITIQSGLLSRLAEYLKDFEGRQIAVVTDRHVARRYLKAVLHSLRCHGLKSVAVILPPGERSKTLGTISTIIDTLAKHKFERRSMLIALGGGVVGDLTGFAAAIYQRGIDFVQVPTTLVAQVDSSVGGKTGVDHRLGKNLIGAFRQPKAVFVDPDTLHTLPKREWVAGLAEVIKYGIIADESFFTYLENSLPALLKLEERTVMRVLARSCEIKAQVVAEDEHESNRRRILNYGHTIGHALESLTGYRTLLHGEAIGIGLAQEAELAFHMGMCGKDVVERIKALVQCTGLSDRMPKVTFGALWESMQHDKKVVGGQVIGVWPIRIGEVVIAPLDKHVCADWYQRKHLSTRRRDDRQRLQISRSRPPV